MLFISFPFFHSSSLLVWVWQPCSENSSRKTVWAPRWNLEPSRPGAGRPLATAQRFALEKQSQTCDTVLALWTASKQPPSPAFPLKKSSAVHKGRNSNRPENALLSSVWFNQEVPFKLSVPFKLYQVKMKVWCKTFLFIATEITLETAMVAEGGTLIWIMCFLNKRGRWPSGELPKLHWKLHKWGPSLHFILLSSYLLWCFYLQKHFFCFNKSVVCCFTPFFIAGFYCMPIFYLCFLHLYV